MSKQKEVAHGMTWAVLDKPGVELYHVVLTFRVQRDVETGALVGFCDELGVSSFGRTVGDAIDKVVEATLLYLNTLESQGERRRVFDERRIEVHHGRPESGRGTAVAPNDSKSVTIHPNDVVTTRVLANRA